MSTHFYEWFDVNDVETRQEKENLLKSVQEECKAGHFVTIRKCCRLFVDGGAGVILQLVSETARFAFIREVERIEAAGDLEEDC